MHYYKKNIGDYAKKTGRLSMLQHGAYTLLIDSCYDREKFPTYEEAIDWTWASNPEEIEAVKFVLSKFFTLENDVYMQKRIQEELDEYHNKAATNQRVALERETKRKENSTNRAQGVNESPPNHKPITNNQEPSTKNKTKKKGATASPFVIDSRISKEVWSDWHNFRNSQKGWTYRAKQLSANKLLNFIVSGKDPKAIVEQSIERGWTGLFEVKADNAASVGKATQTDKSPADRVMRLFGESQQNQFLELSHE